MSALKSLLFSAALLLPGWASSQYFSLGLSGSLTYVETPSDFSTLTSGSSFDAFMAWKENRHELRLALNFVSRSYQSRSGYTSNFGGGYLLAAYHHYFYQGTWTLNGFTGLGIGQLSAERNSGFVSVLPYLGVEGGYKWAWFQPGLGFTAQYDIRLEDRRYRYATWVFFPYAYLRVNFKK